MPLELDASLLDPVADTRETVSPAQRLGDHAGVEPCDLVAKRPSGEGGPVVDPRQCDDVPEQPADVEDVIERSCDVGDLLDGHARRRGDVSEIGQPERVLVAGSLLGEAAGALVWRSKLSMARSTGSPSTLSTTAVIASTFRMLNLEFRLH